MPAPHFYLELLRQRLTNASLNFSLSSVKVENAWLHEGTPILRVDADFSIENTGRIAAYKWSLVLEQYAVPSDRTDDFLFGAIPGAPPRTSGLRVDDTILPSCRLNETRTFGVKLRQATNNEQGIREDLVKMFSPLSLTLRVATETSPGESKSVDVGPAFSTEEALTVVRDKGLIG